VAATVPLSESIFLYSLDWSASRGLILTQAGGEGYVHPILIIDPCTGEKRVLVQDIGDFGGPPRWSPDGSMILIERYEQHVLKLYILDPDTAQMRLLLPQVGLLAVWSPDSRWVLVKSEVKGKGLYIVSVSDGQYWKIPNTDGEVEGAGFNSYDWLFPSP
jgi:Tol biopolymer transport system component